MSVSIFRFSTAMGFALLALLTFAGAAVAQDAEPAKPKSAALNSTAKAVQHVIRMRTRQRDTFREHLKAGMEGAFYELQKDQDWIPTEDIDSSLISNYWIGVQCAGAGSTTFSPQEAAGAELTVEGGMKILAVTEGGAAEASGLKEGDVLLKFSGNDMNSLNDLYAVIGETKTSEASLLVVRDGGLVSMKITPQERPKEVEESAVADESLHRIQLSTVEDALNVEMQGKQLPEGYRLQFELVRGKDVSLKVMKDDDSWNADGKSIDSLPEPVQAVASSIVEKCEPMVTSSREDMWLLAWQAGTSPAFRHVHQVPPMVFENNNTQLDDIRRELKQLAEVVKKLEEKLGD